MCNTECLPTTWHASPGERSAPANIQTWNTLCARSQKQERNTGTFWHKLHRRLKSWSTSRWGEDGAAVVNAAAHRAGETSRDIPTSMSTTGETLMDHRMKATTPRMASSRYKVSRSSCACLLPAAAWFIWGATKCVARGESDCVQTSEHEEADNNKSARTRSHSTPVVETECGHQAVGSRGLNGDIV